MEMVFVMVFFFAGGAALGVLWQWRSIGLFALCAILGFATCLILRDWKDFDLSAIIANARSGGVSWTSWVFEFVTLFILSAGPTVAGGSAGFILRSRMKKVPNRVAGSD